MSEKLRFFDPQLKEKPEQELFIEPEWLIELRQLDGQIRVRSRENIYNCLLNILILNFFFLQVSCIIALYRNILKLLTLCIYGILITLCNLLLCIKLNFFPRF